MTPLFRSFCAAGLALTAGWLQTRQDSPGCQFNIVSSTVVAAYCGHFAGDGEVLDVLIAWRGEPGWFHRGTGTSGSGGSRLFGPGTKGRVTQRATYNDVTLSFDADFDAGTVAVGELTYSLKSVNMILIDHVDRAGARLPSPPLWIEPRLPLGVDVNEVLARRSPELRRFLRCDVPMPPALAPQPPVVTVCEKLAAKGSGGR